MIKMDLEFIGWLTPRWKVLFREMPDSLDNCTVLDVGCGQGVLGFLIRHNYRDDDVKIYGIDGYKPYITALDKMNVYDDVCCNRIDAIRNFNKSFDYTFCLDVLEHNDKDYSLFLLETMHLLTKNKLFVTVPHEEPLHNEKRRNKWLKWRDESDNKYNGHISSWGVHDFTGDITVFDNRKDMTKSIRVFDSIRRKLLGVDWDEKHILAVLDGLREQPLHNGRNVINGQI